VTIDIVASDGQDRVLQALEQKTQKAITLHTNLVNAVNHSFSDVRREFKNTAKLPSFFRIDHDYKTRITYRKLLTLQFGLHGNFAKPSR